MDSRAKQRITGAVILVAVFVLLVPELLTGPGRNRDAPAAPPAAADESGLRQYTIDLDAPSNPVPPAPAPDAAVELPTPPVAAVSPMAAPGEAAEPEAALPEPTPTPAPVVAQPAPAKPESPATKPPAGGSGGFAVQLGSFAVRDNADRLAREMNAKGFAASVAPLKVNGRELYRVLVGPTRDRPAAEALAAQLRRIGQAGSIVSIS
jgi:DedD protein